jgi:hypothetical protein
MIHKYRRTACSLSGLVAVLVTAACAPLARVATPELAGTPSSTGCDAWFNIGGTFARMNDVGLALTNRSTNRACLATRVQFLFAGPVRAAAVRVTTPAGWASREVPCDTGGGVCGFEWRTDSAGVEPGRTRTGFGLTYDPADTPLAKLWIVDVGRRRVQLPIVTVGDEPARMERTSSRATG